MDDLTDDPRQKLLTAAGEVFAERGFRSATVREICGRVGANLAAVNYYFGDKERLYIAAVQAAHCSGANGPPRIWPPGTPAAEKLRDFIFGMLSHILDDSRPAWHARLMMRELAEPTSACAALVEAYIRPMAQILGAILDELLPVETSEVERSMTAFSIVGQCLFYKVHRPIAEVLVGPAGYRQFQTARLAQHITQFSLAALGCSTPPSFRSEVQA